MQTKSQYRIPATHEGRVSLASKILDSLEIARELGHDTTELNAWLDALVFHQPAESGE